MKPKNIDFSPSFLNEIESSENEKKKQELLNEVLKFLETQFEKMNELGRGKAGIVWQSTSPESITEKYCVKINYNPTASVNYLDKEFRLQEDFYRAGGRTPKPVASMNFVENRDFHQVIVMEKISGMNLEEYILDLENSGEKVTPTELDQLVNDLSEQINILHKAGIIHRDLNLKNVMITDKGKKATIIDFGDAARTFSADDRENYSQEVYRDGQKKTFVFSRDEDVLVQIRQEFIKRGLIERALDKDKKL